MPRMWFRVKVLRRGSGVSILLFHIRIERLTAPTFSAIGSASAAALRAVRATRLIEDVVSTPICSLSATVGCQTAT